MIKTSRADLAYDHILQKMLTRELKPGDWLDRKSIAEELRFSVMPVNQAIQKLVNEGMLVSLPRRGTQVRIPDLDEVRGQLTVREALETQAARLYCGQPVHDAIDRLLPLAELADSGDQSAAWKTDVTFHRSLMKLANCEPLLANFDRLMRLAVFQISMFTASDINRADNHVCLLSDLARCTPSEAEERIRYHIHAGKSVLFPG